MMPEIYERVGYDDRWIYVVGAVLIWIVARKWMRPPLAGVLIATGLFGLTYFIPGTEWLLRFPMTYVTPVLMLVLFIEQFRARRKEGERTKWWDVAWVVAFPIMWAAIIIYSEQSGQEQFRVQGDAVIVSGSKPGTVARSEARVLSDGDSWHLKSPNLHYPIDKDAIYIRRRKAISGAELGERLKVWAESSPTGTHTQ